VAGLGDPVSRNRAQQHLRDEERLAQTQQALVIEPPISSTQRILFSKYIIFKCCKKEKNKREGGYERE